jgi:glucokinase
LFLDEAREHYAARVTGAGHRPLARIRPAQLGDDSALVGAATLAAESASPMARIGLIASTPTDPKKRRFGLRSSAAKAN